MACSTTHAPRPDACARTPGVALQILGSGGPIADDARAGTGYLVWHGGRSRFLIDVGGGSMTRFGVAGGAFAELDAVALSHYHVDHTADLSTLLKSGYFSNRTRAMIVAGPDGAAPFPDLATFLNGLLGRDGAYGYLSGYLHGSDDLVPLNPLQVATAAPRATIVYRDAATTLTALGVEHGMVPALAYRLDIEGRRIVFAGDQNGAREGFVEFARDADLLVMHMVVPEGARGAARRLHATPSRIGALAAAAGADTLVLSHLMARSLRNLDANLAEVRRHFGGHVILAEDLLCVAP